LDPPPEADNLLVLRPMPEVAGALRARKDRIVQRWTTAVDRHLPHADPLTVTQVRNSVPNVVDKIALALESGSAEAVHVLTEVGTAHGVARFQQHYDIEEVMIEYRLLRRIVFDELYHAIGYKLTFMDAIPVDMGVDTALHRGTMTYVRHLTEELGSAAAAESKFLAFLSHDLRNNLGGATLLLHTLEQRLAAHPQFAEELQDVRALRTSVQETVTGMERLLQAERLRRETVALQLAAVDLPRLVADLIGQVARAAEAKGVRVESAVPPNAATHSDRELLALAIQNLLGNAVKYSTHGVVRIEVREHDLGWVLSVSDQGPGIAPGRVKELFNAFTRGEAHGQAGMGLGLSIASHAARQLGSELHVESTVGKGSTFSFTLPPAKPEDAK
jgi:signal transduction histidine kinase